MKWVVKVLAPISYYNPVADLIYIDALSVISEKKKIFYQKKDILERISITNRDDLR